MFGMTAEGIRHILKRSGETLRPSGGSVGRINDLAEEIFGDLEDHFGGQCSREDMQEWLGETAERVADAVLRLHRSGWIAVEGDTIRALERQEKPAPRNQERNAAIMDMFAAGVSRRAIAQEFGLTINTVTGVIWRHTTMGKPRARTPRHVTVLKAIKTLTKDGVAPTIREIASHLGLKGLSGVHASIRQLEEAGEISRAYGLQRYQNRGISLAGEPRA